MKILEKTYEQERRIYNQLGLKFSDSNSGGSETDSMDFRRIPMQHQIKRILENI